MPPEGPTGVRLRRADGTVLNCELAYEGTDDDGMHQWRIANAVYRPGDQVTVETMPGFTGLTFTARPGLTGATIDWTDEDGSQHQTELKMNRKQRRKRRWR